MQPPQSIEEIKAGLETTEKGGVRQSIRNCLTVFQRDPLLSGAIAYNILTDRKDIIKPIGFHRESTALNDTDMKYPVAGCIRESVRFGITEAGNLCYQVSKAILYSLLLNSATFLIAIWIVFWLRSSARAIAVTALVTFVLSLYLGYGMMFDLPVAFLATYQIREAVFSVTYFLPWAILVGVVWIVALITFSWISFRKCELK